MQEVTVNRIIEVIHCDGWKYVIKKSEEDVAEPNYFNLEIDYYDNSNENQ